MYIAAPSSSYCSRTLATTDATYNHEVAPQPQPTLLLPSFSSAIAAAFRLRSPGCHLPINISHQKNHSLDDIAALTFWSFSKKLKRDSRTHLRQLSPLRDVKRSD
ncbi:hypothetical protein B296_00016989 [Ensete ventricosum]|uniref:Uncharacterized protein n=1 Tax=Ensete ventricosum TaxID=4639 RepID=A0A426YNR4_ENSVE|nr:hypothetical protein B296_00016989 [Ensete ventricosum]